MLKAYKDPELQSELKDPDSTTFWQIRHNPSDFLVLAVYSNGKIKLKGEYDVQREVNKIYPKLTVTQHIMDRKITEFSTNMLGNHKLDYSIGKMVIDPEVVLEQPAEGFGSLGFLMKGEKGEKKCLYAVTAGHVLLTEKKMMDINVQEEGEPPRYRFMYFINTHKTGLIKTQIPPMFGYAETYQHVPSKLPWFDVFLQDIGVLELPVMNEIVTKKECPNKKKVDTLFKDHEYSSVEGFLGGEKVLTIKRGILRIEAVDDLRKLEERRVHVQVGDTKGYVVKGPHYRILKKKETPKIWTPEFDELCEPAARLYFVTERP